MNNNLTFAQITDPAKVARILGRYCQSMAIFSLPQILGNICMDPHEWTLVSDLEHYAFVEIKKETVLTFMANYIDTLELRADGN